MSTIKLTANLPSKRSEVIMIALEDLVIAERSKKYKINMEIFHEPNSVCKVCFAGGIIARSDGANYKLNLGPENFSAKEKRALNALDYIRQYALKSFFQSFKGTWLDLNVKEQKAIDAAYDYLEAPLITVKQWWGSSYTYRVEKNQIYPFITKIEQVSKETWNP